MVDYPAGAELSLIVDPLVILADGREVAPAVVDAGLEPIRADEEMTGGVIHKPMFERLILCEYAVADLSTANATSSTNSACATP